MKKNKGITLVALVITIIILLILARNIDIKSNRKWNINKSWRHQNSNKSSKCRGTSNIMEKWKFCIRLYKRWKSKYRENARRFKI